MNKMIAVVGMAGSGKTIVCDLLKERGYKSVYFGGVIYQKMKEEGIEITPESQKIFREELRKKFGMGVVAEMLVDSIKELYLEHNVVLDGLYSWDEYKILKEEFPHLVVLAIIADKNIRYKRIGVRKERAFSLKEIEERDLSEIENMAKGGPIAYADYYILNNGDLEKYLHDLTIVIEKIENGSV